MECMRLCLCVVLFLSVLIAVMEVADAEVVPLFQFRRYTYRKKQKHERRIKNLKANCEDRCRQGLGLEDTICTRRCMSESCYDEIYAHDQLEEGEIDVRYTSFKGCIVVTKTDL